MGVGIFNNSSYWGYKGSILKSGVCKYFRREMFDKFEWCVMEMMIFGLRNIALMTNIVNRLKILIMEEICVDELEVICKCVLLFDMIDNEKEYYKKVILMKNVCDIVKNCRKCRMVSYVNNWWKYNEVEEYEEIKLNKVLKYKKKGDSNELMKLGEYLIGFIENKNEGIIDIFNKMIKMENEGLRYRRKNGVYLYFEIINDICIGVYLKKIFSFVLTQFNKINMKERVAFGIWIGLICIKNVNIDVNINIDVNMNNMNEQDVVEYLFRSRQNIIINEDFVVNDFHVNKKFGLEKFGKVGSYVENEQLSLLGENGLKYKEFYILKKSNVCEVKVKNGKKKKVKTIFIIEDDDVVEDVVENVVVVEDVVEVVVEDVVEDVVISFDEFELIKVIVDGVCGMKKCCLIVKRNGELFVLKEMNKSFNYGKDYMCVDELKIEFGLLDLNMTLIRSDKSLCVIDKNKRTWKNNWMFEEKVNVVYCMMKFYENKGDLGKNKDILNDKKNVKSMLKIRLFDGLFRSSDNILRNILVLNNNDLLSIDENDIFGKRQLIFNKNDWCLKNDLCKELYSEVVDELWGNDKEKRKTYVINKLIKYGFGNNIEEFVNRWEKYKELISNEMK